MKKYYIHLNDRQEGPFSLDELRGKYLTSDSLIWYNGLPEWTIVRNLAEVNELIPQAPPPIKKQPFTTFWRFLRFAAFVFLLGLVIMGINSYVNKSDNYSASLDSYQEKIMTVEEIEKSDPLRFLSATGQYRETIFGKKYVLYMKIENSATVAEYKDVVVKIEYISATNSVITSEERRFYEFFPPHSTKNYEFKISKPSASSKLRAYVIQALAN